ncbi:unnamed protein product [Arctia plantaginis]|uniref:unspecific monooxygenase n=1 Tax=Arctia plantaginis TaxID=874455 RepID=A0A8S1BAU8_ARCPL|nr:unnamed protein product [Arctia plantaginis]
MFGNGLMLRNYRRRGIPHYPPHPILGSLTFLQRQNPSIWMRQLYKDFKAPYVGIWLFWRPGLVINSPEITRRILVKDSENFRNHFLSSGKTDPIGSLNLFTVNDPIWTSLRRRLTGVFTSAKLKMHSGIVRIKTNDLLERIRDETSKNNNIHLRKLLSDFTVDIIGESAFGIVSESVKTGNSVMKEIAQEFMNFGLHRGLSWSSIFFFPELVDVFRFSFFPKHTIERLRLICRSVINQRGGFEKKMKEPKDLLDALIKMKQEASEEGEEMSEDFLVAQASIFLVGGFDTSASTMSWVIYHLAWHPEHQQRLYDEILNLKQKYEGEDLSPSALSELTYYNCVIKETLRHFPPMGWLDRVATKDYQIDENLTIPAGTPVYLNAVGMQVDPQYFPDPMVFNPDRFLPENERNNTPFTFLPFGDGPRACIGMRFAFHVLRQALSSIIYNFEIRVVPDTPKPNEVEVEKKGTFFMPMDERMVVQFVPRENLQSSM